MAAETIETKKLPTPDEITKTLQHHLDKFVPIVTAVEVEIATNKNIPVERLLGLYKQQVDMEGAIQWIINLEKRYNPSKIIHFNKPGQA